MMFVRTAAPYLLATTLACSAHAGITDKAKTFSLLCTTEQSTGFNWKNGKWVQTNFHPENYIIKKLKPDDIACVERGHPKSSVGEPIGCYDMREVGSKDGDARTCTEYWPPDGQLTIINCITGGFTSYRAEPEGSFVLTQTYAVFISGEKRDSLVLTHGKCSIITD